MSWQSSILTVHNKQSTAACTTSARRPHTRENFAVAVTFWPCVLTKYLAEETVQQSEDFPSSCFSRTSLDNKVTVRLDKLTLSPLSVAGEPFIVWGKFIEKLFSVDFLRVLRAPTRLFYYIYIYKENYFFCFLKKKWILCCASSIFSCFNHTFPPLRTLNYICLLKEPGVDPPASFSSLKQISSEYKAEFVSESWVSGELDVIGVRFAASLLECSDWNTVATIQAWVTLSPDK